MADAVVSEKQCARCGEVKLITDFPIAKGKRTSSCRTCTADYHREYNAKNADRIKALKAESRRVNFERDSAVQKAWRERNRERKLANDRAYAVENAEKARERARKWYWENRDRSLAASRTYRAQNLERLKEFDRNRNRPENYQPQRNEKTKRRYRTDDKMRIHALMSANMRHSLKHKVKNGRSWLSLVPYTKADLKKRLMKTLPAGYTWDDFMAGKLHIDHIIPVSAFNFTCPEDIDFQRCWDLKNLQLLPASENCSKGARLSNPFQPSFVGL